MMLRKAYFRYTDHGIAIYRRTDDRQNFQIVDINKAGMKMCHVAQRPDVIGHFVTAVFPGVIALGLFEAMQDVAEHGGCRKLPAREYRNTVRTAWVKNIVFRIPTNEIVVIFEDVTPTIQRFHLEEEFLARSNWMLISALEQVSCTNDAVTGAHVRRIGAYATCLARAYGLPQILIDGIRRYASLHDIGKIGLRSELLFTSRQYTDADRAEMRQHVRIGADLLRHSGCDPMGVNIAEFHHEQWDGSGYLQGLSGTEIPIEARIVALADYYDAVRMERPYKSAYTREEAEQMIRQASGTRFNPKLVQVFVSVAETCDAIYEEMREASSHEGAWARFHNVGSRASSSSGRSIDSPSL